jgi:RimJ/RimL family protein N-acetyltransferase
MSNVRALAMPDPLLIDLPVSIETKRLLLRPPQPGDGPAVFEAIDESLPELRVFLASLPWVAGEQSVALSESWCRQAQANFLARRDLPFLLFDKTTGFLVGASGLHRPVWEAPKVEVGYWVRTSRRGSGLITEAVVALTEYAFNYIGAVRVELVTDEANTRARKVAERCHFALEGVLRNERRAPDGSLRNTCIYARIPPAP